MFVFARIFLSFDSILLFQPSTATKLINVPQDSDLFVMKRKEALEKFQILVELEKLLSPTFLKREDGNK